MRAVELRPHSPKILSSSNEARAVVLEIPAGESLQDHQVHERAWVSVIDGEVEITTSDGERVAGASGLVIEFAPGERHAVRALTAARLFPTAVPVAGGRPSRDDAAQRQGNRPPARGRAPSEPVTGSSDISGRPAARPRHAARTGNHEPPSGVD